MIALFDLLLPQRCLGCSRTCRLGICDACLRDAPKIDRPSVGDGFDIAHQVFAYQGLVRDAIKRLKYRGERQIAYALSRPLVPLVPPNATVTWVPSHPARIRARGNDHTGLLASCFSTLTELPVAPLLERVSDPPPQVSLAPQQRRLSPKGTMRATMPSPREVCILDDVFTTGATLTEAAKVCKQAGAVRVTAVCVARSGNSSTLPRAPDRYL